MNLKKRIQDCTMCPLHKDMPCGNYPVPGDGNPKADLMLVGEALGKEESIIELPFQGQAGSMLDKMLEDAKIDRSDIYITNAVKCRPTKNKGKSNRPPTKMEISICKLWLWEEMIAVQPKVIVTLGRIPTGLIIPKEHLKLTFKLGDVVGKHFFIDFGKVKTCVIPNYHPSFLMQYGRSYMETSIKTFKKALRISRK
jgi:DNA polymerase